MIKYSLTVYLLVLICVNSLGQEKNFEVISTSITCDQLPDTFNSKNQALELLKSTKFRYQQNFKIRRKKGLKAGDFYSCDNLTGFLIVQIDDQYDIYRDVTIPDWESLIASNDPEYLLISELAGKYVKIRE